MLSSPTTYDTYGTIGQSRRNRAFQLPEHEALFPEESTTHRIRRSREEAEQVSEVYRRSFLSFVR